MLLLISVFVIATCGLIYELIAGTLASYLLGDSITQFSTIIGCYLFAMGIGSWLSRFINRNLLGYFIKIEILVGLVGGSSAAVLFLLFEHVYSFRMLLYFIVTLTGILVGIWYRESLPSTISAH
jgi:spermidine synthase